MKTATVKLKGISPISWGRNHCVDKFEKEQPDEYERRTWKEKFHYDKSGTVVIPAMALKNSLFNAAKMLGMRIPGKGRSQYNKHFEAGVMVVDNAALPPNTRETVSEEKLFLPANGQRGSGTRVWKHFPVIDEGWKGSATYHILDDIVTKDVFETHLREAGNFVGFGFFRPERGGIWGRFVIEGIKWTNGAVK